ncbi:MAG: hypothetical protein EBT07_16610 [Actinobacteria bacterium]|nr:hypothetical protein [Actinomycetota bacterium]
MAIVDISGVSAGALNLKNLMDGVLEKTIEVFEEYNVPLPSRQFWTVGEPAIDCEQLVVSFIQTYLGLPGNQASEPQRCQSPRSVVLTISISREIPVVGVNGKAPTGDKIEEASRIAVVDAWMFMELINKLDQWEPGEFGLGVIATADSSGFDGGFQTTAMQLTMVVP